tara:strand:- start:127 stop:393 length:267 start_codon:yes stop_codon:yes gene_type:complete
MLSKEVHRIRKHYQRKDFYPSKQYPEYAKQSLDVDLIKAREHWRSKFRQYRLKDPELKKMFSESYQWFDIGIYILNMLKTIRNELNKV